MQPESNHSSPKASTRRTNPRTPSPQNQHGLRCSGSPAFHGLSSNGEPGNAAAAQLRGSPNADSGSIKTERHIQKHPGLLKTSYNDEDAQDDGKFTSDGSDIHAKSLKFTGNPNHPPQGSSPINKLPNELLTHALSHLPPNDLSSSSLVSKRFHALITSPHAWRAAFARYFPGPATIAPATKTGLGKGDSFQSDKRAFCRLTALSTWRSEYIIRTRLLRSLARGKPSVSSTTSTPRGFAGSGSAVVMYNSQLLTTVNHIDVNWGSGLAKTFPRLIHGADEFGKACASDPITGKVDNRGIMDPQGFRQFSDIYGGATMYGLGPGNVIGIRNVMDVSQPHGMVYGEGLPDGGVYYRATDESRGRFLLAPLGLSEPEVGIPKITREIEAVSAVWIAKTAAIPSLTEGLLGIMVGSSLGVVSAYSLGSSDLRHLRFSRGELTARWVLSPGVPIIALAVDENYSLKRQAQNRIWAIALNALGELYYLTKFPKRQSLARDTKLDAAATERMAWSTGRSVYWNLVEPSRRMSRPDPFQEFEMDGSYSPRTSWTGMCLTGDQVRAETVEIEAFLKKFPYDFRKTCYGWDMRRRIEVDFAGDDGNFAGESIAVFGCGLDEDTAASVKRYTRFKVPEHEGTLTESSIPTPDDDRTPVLERESIFGPSNPLQTQSAIFSPSDSRGRSFASVAYSSVDVSPERISTIEEWRCSLFSFNNAKGVQISTTAIDCSTYATLTMSEDPALGMLGSSEASSTFGSPFRGEDRPATPSDLPGQRSRFVAAGTSSGNVFIWDCRAAMSRSTDVINEVEPVRIIYTDSPEISCLALTALQIVVGGSDGLVQAWDPLASSMEPIRTFNSRFSSRARRRLAQAQASPAGVGINMFAAGAICLDPDPSVLRGVVSLGNHLRYWSYSSLSAEQYKGTKRLKRRSERGSNQHGGDFVSIRNSNLKSYIENERHELEQEDERSRREKARLRGRFGIDMMESEEQALAYATLLSEESMIEDEQRRSSKANTPALSSGRFATPTKEKASDEIDADLAEAIRQSLESTPQDVGSREYTPPYSPSRVAYDIPIRMGKKGRRSTPKSSSRSPPTPLMNVPEASNRQEMDDLEFALQLSLAEEQSRGDSNRIDPEFPGLPNEKGKGKATK
ncbi:uncharacterized protein PV09_06737 [Verruconis gallopava]|uniref:F-box domain-containing protein n=1 Tax=Verruconis gallopava TaxID=253628 RepID=A0A0D2ART4_9PEZI|nr:uncharacterized protein PV09_06737 [Verruconis gallopava]KIW01894.1 hypothetical protein PV09_06737 [Verruconis gallopava]